jgi:D-serine deaminase-like pyridoxal phosphate-dependent protein
VAATAVQPDALARERSHEELESIFADVDAPFALVDLDALWSNAREMLGRAAGTALRVASKSVRCRALLAAILARDPGFRGLMTFTLAESLWLHGHGFEDLLLAYPTADRQALAELARLDSERPPILMVDSVEQLDLIEGAAPASARPLRVCIELDVGWWSLGGRIKIGAKRSPVRTPEQAQALARAIAARPRFGLAALMGYEAHIAGLGDRPLGKHLQEPLIRLVKRRSAAEIAERRAAVVAAVSEVAPVPIVNGGGTGSIHLTRRERVITEITAGSGFYAPTLFDRYADFRLTPAAMFALPVVRRPGGGVATLLGGGYPASGVAGKDRLPQPYLPRGLRLDPLEGAGEVQTPVVREGPGLARTGAMPSVVREGPGLARTGAMPSVVREGPGLARTGAMPSVVAAAAGLRVGDNVYLRHAKAGELCERFTSLYLVSGGQILDEVPTYRGEGRCYL